MYNILSLSEISKMVGIKIKLLNSTAITPVRSYSLDSGVDLFANNDESIVLPPLTSNFVEGGDINYNHARLIPTGVAVELPEPIYIRLADEHSYETLVYEGQLRGRSGLAAKGILCHVGTIDNTYRGELKAVLYNITDKPFTISYGDKIAQLVVVPIVIPSLVVVDELGDSDRASSGFGSTGYRNAK